MNQNDFIKTKLLIIFCLVVFGATDFGKPPLKAAGLVQKQNGEREMPDADSKLKSEKDFFYKSENQTQPPSVTGTYFYKGEGRENKIKVLQTSASEIKVSFESIYQFRNAGGYWNTNTDGITPQTIRLEKGTVVLVSGDESDCRIAITFLKGGMLKAVQSKTGCSFPGGITADGVYRKISSKEPQFQDYSDDPPEAISETGTDTKTASPLSRVRFPKGTNSLEVSGNITDSKPVSYVVGARVAQIIKVEVIDGGAENDVFIEVRGKNGAKLTVEENDGKFFSGRALKTGDYVIIVNSVTTRNTSFKISVSIN